MTNDDDRRAAADAGQLLRDPRPSDALFAEACKLVQAGDYRLAWFKMCEALPKRYEEGFASGERRGIERAAQACENERLSEPQDEADAAYDHAIDHCIDAIRALITDQK